ncbi:hypothetical protein [Peribacillus asahii]
MISNTHEAIILRDMFNAVQNQMRQRKMFISTHCFYLLLLNSHFPVC